MPGSARLPCCWPHGPRWEGSHVLHQPATCYLLPPKIGKAGLLPLLLLSLAHIGCIPPACSSVGVGVFRGLTFSSDCPQNWSLDVTKGSCSGPGLDAEDGVLLEGASALVIRRGPSPCCCLLPQHLT